MMIDRKDNKTDSCETTYIYTSLLYVDYLWSKDYYQQTVLIKKNLRLFDALRVILDKFKLQTT